MNPVYLLFTLAFCFILLFLLQSWRARRKKNRLLQQLRAQWGQPVSGHRDFAMLEYYNRISTATGTPVVPQQTANDLDLYPLFEYLDRTCSKPGRQYLFRQLHQPTQDIAALHAFDRLTVFFEQETAAREAAQTLLLQLSSDDAYYIATLLEENYFRQPSWARWLLFDQLLVLVLLLGSLWFPVLLIWSLLPFALNTFLHLWGKFNAQRHLKSLPQLALLIRTAKQLSQAALPVQQTPEEEIRALQPFLRKFGLFKQVYIKDELGQVFVFFTGMYQSPVRD